ncbi:hypothetical protein N0V87_004599 [Didymella glomerata]|uniref:Uncharacterized protein n=1 Tax=Didymella glomerata TaxID=749621 RepID=A0A9W8X0A2_9PLEO|nr:hypothetical protein N0V87_004599 [Didymella glomerata]
MYSPSWGSDPFDLPAYLARGAKSRRSSGHWPDPPRSSPFPFFRPPPPVPYGMKPRSGLKSFHPKLPKLPKYARFSDLDPPLSSDLSTSDWDDAYALDSDSDFSPIPSFSPRRRYARPDPIARPDISLVSLPMLRPMAQELRLRHDEALFLPPLVHLRILLVLAGGREELHIAIPGSVAFEHVTKRVVQCYAGKGVPYTAQVEQRGRMCEPPRDAVLEDLAHRGEVYRGGRREMKAEIVVNGDEGWGVRDRFRGQGPSGTGDAEVETVRKREVSRTRYTKAKR